MCLTKQWFYSYFKNFFDNVNVAQKESMSCSEDSDSEIPIFIFEKPTVNNITTENITKDGLHMLIGLGMSHEIQCVLRDNILDKIHDVLRENPDLKQDLINYINSSLNI